VGNELPKLTLVQILTAVPPTITVHQCQSSQFFLIIGVLAHILSIPTPFIPKIVGLGPVPNLVGLVLVFLAGEWVYFA
jgi:hypothetical protein